MFVLTAFIILYQPMIKVNASGIVALQVDVIESHCRVDVYNPDPYTNNNGTYMVGNVSCGGYVTITNVLASTAISDAYVYLSNGNSSSWIFNTTARPGRTTTGTVVHDDGLVTVHIPYLAPGQYARVDYTVYNNTTNIPFDVHLSYTNNRLAAFNGSSTIVNFTLTRNCSVMPCTDNITNISIQLSSGNYNGGPTPDFVFSPDIINFSNLTATNTSATNSTVATISNASDFKGTYTTSLYLLSNATMYYSIPGASRTVTGISVVGISGMTTGITLDLTKRFTSGNWYFTPKVNVVATDPGLDYTLTNVTLWVTTNDNLNTVLNTTSYTSGFSTLNNGNPSWTTSAWNPGTINGIPAGFIKAYFNITNETSQYYPTYITNNGTDTFTNENYIWVINGYFVEANKTITPTGTPGNFTITITVTNLGSVATPYVVVYDIVSNNFTAGNFNPVYNGTQGISINGITGMAYWWNVSELSPIDQPGNTTTITYNVVGDDLNTYNLSELYVIGIDPTQSLNIKSTPRLSSSVTMLGFNYETVAAVSTIGLIIVGMIGTARRRLK